jgi:hypothetical protein
LFDTRRVESSRRDAAIPVEVSNPAGEARQFQQTQQSQQARLIKYGTATKIFSPMPQKSPGRTGA